MLRRLAHRIARLLWRRGSGAPVPPAAPAELSDIDYEARLVAHMKEVIANAGAALAGRVNLLGLSHIKEHFGESWQRVADRAERIARSVIERNLSRGDIYAKWDDFDFLVIFVELSAEAAQIKCAMLAEQIARELVGEDGGRLVAVKTAILRGHGELDFEDVPINDALSQLLPLDAPDPARADPDLPPLDGGDSLVRSQPDPGPPWQELVVTKRLRPNPVAPPALDEELNGLRVRFRPVWDPARRNALLNQCVPLIMAPEAEEISWPAEFVIGNDAGAVVRIDLATCRAAIGAIGRLVQQDQRILLSVPVHFETLAKLSARLDYIRALDRLSRVEQRLLLFELLAVPRGVLQARLLELILPLRARVYGMVARVDLSWRDFTPIAANGLRAVGIDIAPHIGPEDALARELLAFERNVRKAKLVAYVHGVQSRFMINALRDSFAYLSGDAISPLMRVPTPLPGLDFADS